MSSIIPGDGRADTGIQVDALQEGLQPAGEIVMGNLFLDAGKPREKRTCAGLQPAAGKAGEHGC